VISGSVNRRLEAIVPLRVLNAFSVSQQIETILDTGVTGALTLPPAAIENLGLAWRSRSSAVLATGQIEEFDVFAATIMWNDGLRNVLVQAIDNVPLLGMRLLAGFDLKIQVVSGGVVEIAPTVE